MTIHSKPGLKIKLLLCIALVINNNCERSEPQVGSMYLCVSLFIYLFIASEASSSSAINAPVTEKYNNYTKKFMLQHWTSEGEFYTGGFV